MGACPLNAVLLHSPCASRPASGAGEEAERFALFVAAAVLANNLMIIGELLTKRSRGRRKINRQFLS
jgi:hypothetical protein